jgi:hypothetical protein
MTMTVSMDATGTTNERGEHLFVVTFGDGAVFTPITATAQSFSELGMRIAQLANSAAQWEAAQ